MAVILLFLWGTLITEPLRVILDIFCELLTGSLSRIGIAADGYVGNSLIILVFALLSLGMTVISKTAVSDYIPCIMGCFTLGIYLIRALVNGSLEYPKVISLVILLIILAVLYFLSLSKPLLWVTDLFVYSPAMFLVAGLILKPLWKMSGIMSVLFYSGRFQSVDLAERYSALLKLPGIVWGIFFSIILLLPTAYYSAGRKKG